MVSRFRDPTLVSPLSLPRLFGLAIIFPSFQKTKKKVKMEMKEKNY
jgi:hypothetical protein